MEYLATTRVVAASDQLSTEIGDDAMILHLDQGVYFGIEGAGQLIWRLVQEPTSVESIVAAVVSEYDVEAPRASADVVAFLDELRDNGLLDVVEPASDLVD